MKETYEKHKGKKSDQECDTSATLLLVYMETLLSRFIDGLPSCGILFEKLEMKELVTEYVSSSAQNPQPEGFVKNMPHIKLTLTNSVVSVVMRGWVATSQPYPANMNEFAPVNWEECAIALS